MMRKFLMSVVTVFMIAAAVFSCCSQTQAFASLITSHKSHDCCNKNPSSQQDHTDHHTCDCHHNASIAPSSTDTVKLVQDVVSHVSHFDFTVVVFSAVDHLAAASFYTGPPDDRVSETPLYYQYSVLRL